MHAFVLTDTAASTGVVPNPYGYPVPPVGNFDNKNSSGSPINSNLMFTSVTITVQNWAPGGNILPGANGLAPNAEIMFVDKSRPTAPQYLKR